MSGAMSSIGRLIAVTSCKGGVGKSTVSLREGSRLKATVSGCLTRTKRLIVQYSLS